MTNTLNKLLADLNVFYRKLQNYHWNIRGKDFFIVHAKLEEYYNSINAQIDEIAEHILIIGGQPIGTMKDYLETTSIEEATNEMITSDVIYSSIIKDFMELLSEVEQIKKLADQNQEYGTSALMDEYIEDYSKKLWMLNQTQNQQ